MTATDTVFAGSIPAIYDQYMVPLLFAPYAKLVAERAAELRPQRILETAAGTGVVTEELHRALPDAVIVATDLNAPMLEEAARRISASNVSFVTADAQARPFGENEFDLVICQFGVMFFPDKVRANAEARRVLRNGGRYMLVIWDRIEHNLATMAAGRAVGDLFPGDSMRFYERVPFAYHDIGLIERDLLAAGFTDIEYETVELRSHAASARDVALGLVLGTPVRSDIEQIDPPKLGLATDAAETALRQFEGPEGFDALMSARLVTAIK
jgi:ubiquinone/menaquinone biosynthesis C-methylase UbiE